MHEPGAAEHALRQLRVVSSLDNESDVKHHVGEFGLQPEERFASNVGELVDVDGIFNVIFLAVEDSGLVNEDGFAVVVGNEGGES